MLTPDRRRMPKPQVSPTSDNYEGVPTWPLPNSWLWTSVTQVGSVQLGKQLTQERKPGDKLVPYLRAANIATSGKLELTDLREMAMTPVEISRYVLAAGDLVLTEASGSATHVGKSAIWCGEIPECCIQNTVMRFRPHAVSTDYAQLVFHGFGLLGIFARVARGVGIQHIGGDRFARLPFPLPPRRIQDRIVDEVTARLKGITDARAALSSAIQGLHRKTNVLLEMATTGQLKAGSRLEEKGIEPPRDELALGTADETPLDTLRVPKHWRVVRIGEAGVVQLGRQRSPEHERGEHMIPYLRVANVFEDRIDTSDILTMNFSPEEQERFRLAKGDILLNEGQSPELVGRPAMYRGVPQDVCFQNTLVRFRAGPNVDPRFAYIVVRHYFRAGRFVRIARGSTNIAHLGAQRFADLPFPLPPLEEQRSIADSIELSLSEIAEQMVIIETSLAKLQPTELELLRSALAGELVPNTGSEETAAALLARMGEPPTPTVSRVQRSKKLLTPMKGNRTNKDLVDALRSAGKPISAEDLFETAGYDRDSSEDIERFYLLLRSKLKQSIRQVNSKDGEVLLEAT